MVSCGREVICAGEGRGVRLLRQESGVGAPEREQEGGEVAETESGVSHRV